MSKYIITQVPPEHADLSFYFDGDCFTENAGGIEYCLFIIGPRGWKDINGEKYSELQKQVEHFTDLAAGESYYFETFKECMLYHGMKWSPRTAHALKVWAKDADPVEPESIAEYLTITTGKSWTTTSANGYCQGDFCEIVYCSDVYSRDDARAAGEVYCGAANEYSITFPAEDDADGEPWTVYGYIVADCQAWRDDDIKALICSWEGIDPAEAELHMIDGQRTYTEYSYRIA